MYSLLESISMKKQNEAVEKNWVFNYNTVSENFTDIIPSEKGSEGKKGSFMVICRNSISQKHIGFE